MGSASLRSSRLQIFIMQKLTPLPSITASKPHLVSSLRLPPRYAHCSVAILSRIGMLPRTCQDRYRCRAPSAARQPTCRGVAGVLPGKTKNQWPTETRTTKNRRKGLRTAACGRLMVGTGVELSRRPTFMSCILLPVTVHPKTWSCDTFLCHHIQS